MTNSEIVSRIANTLNTLTKDVRRSKRYLLNVARSKASFLIAQKLGEKSLIKEDNIYTQLTALKWRKLML